MKKQLNVKKLSAWQASHEEKKKMRRRQLKLWREEEEKQKIENREKI